MYFKVRYNIFFKKVYIICNFLSNTLVLLCIFSVVKYKNKPYFILAKKNCLQNLNYRKKISSIKSKLHTREEIIKTIIYIFSNNSKFVTSTGMISRELYELRKKKFTTKNCIDFLKVGSMGHSSQIATGIALNSKKRIICLSICFSGT